MIQAIIFDKDGTLFDTEKFYFDGWKLFSQKINRDLSHEQILELEMLSKDAQALKAKEYLGNIDTIAFKKQISDYVKNRQMTECPFKPGLLECLQTFQEKGIVMGIASSGRLSLIQKNLQMTGLTHYFSALVSGHNVEKGKPAPDIYLETAKQLGVQPQHCLVVEDSTKALQGAMEAGFQTAFIPDLFPIDPNLEKRIDYICTDLLDLSRQVKLD